MIKNILITTFLLVSSVSADFIRDDNLDVVHDNSAYLMWQDTSDKHLNWEAAMDYCKNSTFAGYENWRVPNFNELYSIVDKDAFELKINSSFKNIANGMFDLNIYWSSTTSIQDDTKAWTIQFSNANNSQTFKSNPSYVRCVRATK